MCSFAYSPKAQKKLRAPECVEPERLEELDESFCKSGDASDKDRHKRMAAVGIKTHRFIVSEQLPTGEHHRFSLPFVKLARDWPLSNNARKKHCRTPTKFTRTVANEQTGAHLHITPTVREVGGKIRKSHRMVLNRHPAKSTQRSSKHVQTYIYRPIRNTEKIHSDFLLKM